MVCAQRKCVYALVGVFVCLQSIAVCGKEGKTLNSESKYVKNTKPVNTGPADQFQWHEHSTLSWDDFRGAVNAVTDRSAAATYCAIGFKTNTPVAGGKPEIIVYNTFYAKKSWVRSDAKIASILEHEQGHFDLCEIYTRKLKEGMGKFDFNVPDVMQALMKIYSEINNSYEARQQAYEQETLHGTNTAQQKKWRDMINNELN